MNNIARRIMENSLNGHNNPSVVAWKKARKTTRIEHEQGCIWIGISPQANGFRWDSSECDMFIQSQVELYEKGGYELMAYVVSTSGERVNLLFADTRERIFSCVISGKVKRPIDANELTKMLQSVGIEAQIKQFELCSNDNQVVQ